MAIAEITGSESFIHVDFAGERWVALAHGVHDLTIGQPVNIYLDPGRFFVFEGRETDTSFAVQIDLDTIEMLKETEPETYWQSKHYEGWPAVLVRYDSPDPERVRRVIEQAYEQAEARKPARKRKT